MGFLLSQACQPQSTFPLNFPLPPPHLKMLAKALERSGAAEADLMQELELTTYKDRWIHVEVSAQPHTSTDCRLVAAYGRHLGFALFC